MPDKGRRGFVALLLCFMVGLGLLDIVRRQTLLPPLASEADILAHSDVGRDVRIVRFAADPAILIFEFGSLAAQGRMFNRIAALVEKAGLPRDRVLDDRGLEAAIHATGATAETWYFGHDYSAAALGRFFDLAVRDAIALTVEERQLRGVIAAAGFFAPGFISSGARGAVISLPAASAQFDAATRATILRHELSHGAYFTDPAYAIHVARFWTTVLTEDERAAFVSFLAGEEYDPDDIDMIMNETQAYLVHTADPRFFTAAGVGLTDAAIARLRGAFFEAMPDGWLRAASMPGD